MINKSKLTILLLSFILIKTAYSQQLSNFSGKGDPIEIFADEGIEWHKKKKKYVAVGNARALSGTL